MTYNDITAFRNIDEMIEGEGRLLKIVHRSLDIPKGEDILINGEGYYVHKRVHALQSDGSILTIVEVKTS